MEVIAQHHRCSRAKRPDEDACMVKAGFTKETELRDRQSRAGEASKPVAGCRSGHQTAVTLLYIPPLTSDTKATRSMTGQPPPASAHGCRSGRRLNQRCGDHRFRPHDHEAKTGCDGNWAKPHAAEAESSKPATRSNASAIATRQSLGIGHPSLAYVVSGDG